MWPCAALAQLVEQLIRNEQVRGSNPRGGSKFLKGTISDVRRTEIDVGIGYTYARYWI
jgi:hypothetical protein